MHEAQLVRRLRERLWHECEAGAISTGNISDDAQRIRMLVDGFLAEDRHVLARDVRERVVHAVVAAATGYGPLEELMADTSITEIMVNSPVDVFVERAGRLERATVRFDDDEHVLQVVERMLAQVGRRIDVRSPVVDARLRDGSRIHAAIPPVAIDGVALTIRRFAAHVRTLDDIFELGMVTGAQRAELVRLVETRSSVIVSGGTGAGKTTLLATAIDACSPADRIVLIEDAAEVPSRTPNMVRLEARSASLSGDGAISIRELVRNALRMRPDRIVIGEVRGAEAFDLIQALNTGHRGTWSTVHANSASDALHRLETMALIANTGTPHSVIRTMLVRAIDAVIHVERNAEGRRRIAEILPVDNTYSDWSSG